MRSADVTFEVPPELIATAYAPTPTTRSSTLSSSAPRTSLGTIATRTGIPKSSLHRALTTDQDEAAAAT